MRLWSLLLVAAGCDRAFGLDRVVDAPRERDAPTLAVDAKDPKEPVAHYTMNDVVGGCGWVKYETATTPLTCPFNQLDGQGGDTWQYCFDDAVTTFVFGGVTELGPKLDLTTWHHIAISSTGVAVSAYIDANLVGAYPIAIVYDGGSVELGADLDAASLANGLAGRLDDIWIFDRALSKTEIGSLVSGSL